MTNLPDSVPRYAIYRNRKVRIVGYEDGKFDIIDSRDQNRRVRRIDLKFLPSQGRKSR